MSSLDELLNARPTKQVWHEVCLLLAGLDEAGLASVTPRVLSWPAQQRPMPDDWWAQWTAGDVRPHHLLAGVRHLGTLHVAHEDFDEDEGEETGLDEASFYEGATAVAAPSDLSWVALGAAAEWHHNGGDIVRWDTREKDRLTWFLDGGDYHDEPHDLQLSPDGRIVITSVEGHLRAWSAETGDELWAFPELSDSDDEDEDSEDSEDSEAKAPSADLRNQNGESEGPPPDFRDRNDDVEHQNTDTENPHEDKRFNQFDLVRIGFSGDGRRVAFGIGALSRVAGRAEEEGRVAVMEAETGRVVLSLPTGQAFGPVALDANGHLLAHTSPTGQVVVREVGTGTVLATVPTQLSQVNALALSPDGTAVFAAGGTADDAAPAAELLSLTPSHPAGELIQPTELPYKIDTSSVTTCCATRAVWTDHGPYAFITASGGSAGGAGSVLFDSTGRTLWTDPNHQIVSFTPDGRAMVTVDTTIEAWFLPGLATPREETTT
ncbi:hypothetical protein ABGB18_19865 [Nonomuraea sp. B12E4]|uniref:hypothetical protein n=1 Tax=Nonomuraea sp. B12E4 TaxID=3153564 RepID=UPI00325D40AD